MGFYEQFHEKLKMLKGRLEKNVSLILIFHELQLAFTSFLQKIWIVTILFFGLLVTFGERNLESVSSLLVFFVFFGTIIALIGSSSSISGEIGGIADSLLSKSVKRWEYLLSKFVSHTVVILVVYFSVLVVMVGILWNFRFLPDDLNYKNLFFAIGLLGLELAFFSSIGVMFSSIFSKTILSLLASIVVWFILIFVFATTGWGCLYSPVDILKNFALILKDSWNVDYWKILLVYAGSPFVFFGVSLLVFYRKDL